MGFITALSRASLKAKVLRFMPSHGSRGSPLVVAHPARVKARSNGSSRRMSGSLVVESMVHKAHREVERLDVFREGAYRNTVHSRLRDLAYGLEGDAPGGFQLGAIAGNLHRLAHAREVEVVEEDQASARIQRFAQLLDRFHLDLEHCALGHVVQRRAHRGLYAAGGHEMILLDEDAVEEPDAVVRAAAHPHRVFLRHAQARQRLARIEDLRARALDGAHELARARGHAREQLHEIERGALRGEERARLTLDLAE